MQFEKAPVPGWAGNEYRWPPSGWRHRNVVLKSEFVFPSRAPLRAILDLQNTLPPGAAAARLQSNIPNWMAGGRTRRPAIVGGPSIAPCGMHLKLRLCL